MKSSLLSLALLIAASSSMFAAEKISPMGLMFLQKANLEKNITGSKIMTVNGSQYEKVLVTLNEGATVDDFEGYDIDCNIGNKFLVVNLPIDEIRSFSELDAVKTLTCGEVFEPCLDQALKSTKMDIVHAGGEGLPQAFDGTGVIAGLFDTGIDPNHAMFRGPDGTSYRVKRFFNMSNGVTYTDETMSKATTDKSTESHGTHVAGIMAGLGGQNGQYGGIKKVFGKETATKVTGNIPFTGVASGADIAMGGGSLTVANITSGCKKIVDYAKSVGKPAVINLSLGHVVGPHDGSSAFCMALDELGKDAIIFVSSGNDGETDCSLTKTFTASDNSIKTFIAPNKSAYDATSAFWAYDNKPLSFQIALYSKKGGNITKTLDVNNSMILAGTNYTNPSYSHDVDFNNAFSSSSYIIVEKGVDSVNKRAYITLSISWTRNLSTNSSNDIVPLFIVKGAEGQKVLGTVTSDLGFSSLDLAGFDNGNAKESINDNATGKNIIAVGAYSSRSTFITLSGKVYGFNDPDMAENVASFSSYGTSFDGRNLPNICGPGYPVVSAYSRYYYTNLNLTEDDIEAKATVNDRDNHWGQMSGTSMSSPFVAGVGAVMLQANPSLTVSEVRSIMMETATKDEYTAKGDPIQWGAGKINALEAVKKVLNLGGVGEIFADENTRLILTQNGDKQYDVFLAGVDEFNATVYNMSGSAVKTVNFSGNEGTLDASNLSAGVYVVEVKADNAHFTKKIVVK